MVKFQTVRQKARIILNSDDASKTIKTNNIVPVQEQPIIFDGTAGNNVDVSTDNIHVIGHELYEGEPMVYTSTTPMTATPAITNNATLYVKYVSDNIFQLATTNGGAAINITATGAAVQTLTRTITFNGSSDAVVNTDVNIITIPNHNLQTGNRVKYETSGTAIGGLVNGGYF